MLAAGQPLERVLPAFTSNVVRLLLPTTGHLQVGADADLVVLDAGGGVRDVMAGGIFLTGGNQLHLSTTIGGTEVARALRRRNAEGAHIAGTAAGAAFLSEHMIAFGREGASPRAKIVTLAPGLGLTNRTIIDQHFRQRDRLGRLLTALAYNPFAIGIGLDEHTAAFIGPDASLEVVGSGALTIADPSELQFSTMAHVRKNDPVCLIGLKLHLLDHGSTFNLQSREALAAPAIAVRT